MRFLVPFVGAMMMTMVALSPPSISAEGGGYDLLCTLAMSKGTFGGHLQSITWDSANVIDFCLDDVCAGVDVSTLFLASATVSMKNYWSLEKSSRKVLLKPDEPVRGIYFLKVAKGKQNQWLNVYMQDSGLMIESEWMVETLVSPFSLVHGPPLESRVVPYMFAIDWHAHTKQFVFYAVSFDAANGYALDLRNKMMHFYLTWSPDGDDILRLVARAAGAPNRQAFTQLPKGVWTDRENGTLFLFDDELGCVYAVHHWSADMNLAAIYTEDDSRSLDFKVTSTPYEDFFNCPAYKYPKSEALSKKQGRCKVVGGTRRSGDDVCLSELFTLFNLALVLSVVAGLAMVVFVCMNCKNWKESFRNHMIRQIIASNEAKANKMRFANPNAAFFTNKSKY